MVQDFYPYARRLDSTHFDDRPEDAIINLIVVHAISLPPNHFGGSFVEDFFCSNLDNRVHPFFKSIENLRVSSHLYIRREGEVIQFVPFSKRAFHAGESIYEGRVRCNDYSIGIELEGCDTIPFEDVQYHSLCKVLKWIFREIPTTNIDRVCGHQDIAPNRKTDPGPFFNWNYLRFKLNSSI